MKADGKAVSAGTADYATETQWDRPTRISANNLNQNTWYPVVGSLPYRGFCHIKCFTQLDGWSKPSWSTHSSGFTVNLDILVKAYGWGTTDAAGIILNNHYSWAASDANPVGYSQMSNGSVAVFWVRGGGSYNIASDCGITWTLMTSSYTNNEQTVSPTTSYPGISINRSTITANLNGYASSAGNGVTASGYNYVRFGDGTQICWGSCGNNSFSSFGAAFANTDYRIGMSEWKSGSWENYGIGGKSTTGVTLRSENNTMEYIAIGRWK